MKKLNFGDIVLLKFPFTDGKSYKKRPALVISDSEDGDIIVCRVTSQLYKTFYDIFVEDWKSVGLKLPSIIRVHKLATLEKSMVDAIIGRTSNDLKTIIKQKFPLIID